MLSHTHTHTKGRVKQNSQVESSVRITVPLYNKETVTLLRF